MYIGRSVDVSCIESAMNVLRAEMNALERFHSSPHLDALELYAQQLCSAAQDSLFRFLSSSDSLPEGSDLRLQFLQLMQEVADKLKVIEGHDANDYLGWAGRKCELLQRIVQGETARSLSDEIISQSGSANAS